MNVIVLRGKEYPILFDIRNTKAISDKYGGALEDAVMKLSACDIEATAFVLHKLIEEGTKLRNKELGLQEVPPTMEHVEQLITYKDMQDPAFQNAIIETFNDFMGGNVDGQAMKEAGAEILEIARKYSKSKTLNDQTSKPTKA